MQNDYQKKTPAEKKEFREEQIRFWQESGLSQSEYCKRQGIAISAITRRKKSVLNLCYNGFNYSTGHHT
jgi:hypothetical protein